MKLKKYKDEYTEYTYYTKDGKVVRHGLCKDYYENGKIVSELNYKDGKLDGICKGYYKDGELEFEYNYKDGKRDGLCKYYYEDGGLESELNFKEGKLKSSNQNCGISHIGILE